MLCLFCGSDNLKVLDTTDIKNGIRRRRECLSCGERFTTYERAVIPVLMLVKRDGSREDFDREKLKRGIWKACYKRPISVAQIDDLAARIEAHLYELGHSEVSSRVVGDLVIGGLKVLDPIAYIRYAIVYLGLDDLLSVRAEVDKLLIEQQGTTMYNTDENQSKLVTSNHTSELEQGYSSPGSGAARLPGRARYPRETVAKKHRGVTAKQR